jgi:hypothetical protein
MMSYTTNSPFDYDIMGFYHIVYDIVGYIVHTIGKNSPKPTILQVKTYDIVGYDEIVYDIVGIIFHVVYHIVYVVCQFDIRYCIPE